LRTPLNAYAGHRHMLVTGKAAAVQLSTCWLLAGQAQTTVTHCPLPWLLRLAAQNFSQF